MRAKSNGHYSLFPTLVSKRARLQQPTRNVLYSSKAQFSRAQIFDQRVETIFACYYVFAYDHLYDMSIIQCAW